MPMLSEIAQSKPVVEKTDVLMCKIGLTDHKPVPEPVKFSESDPLGSSLLKSASSSGDVLLTLCKSLYQSCKPTLFGTTGLQWIIDMQQIFYPTEASLWDKLIELKRQKAGLWPEEIIKMRFLCILQNILAWIQFCLHQPYAKVMNIFFELS